MPVYSYSAVDFGERTLSGTLIADSPAEARRQLRSRGLQVLEFTPSRATRRPIWQTRVSQRRRETVAEFARSLALLIHSGTAVAEALDVLSKDQSAAFATVLKEVRDRLNSGESFGDALARHPSWFDAIFVSAVRVGELSGNLEESLQELAEHIRGQQTTRRQLTQALTYPLILVCLGTGVVIFLMSFVIPQLLTVLTATGRTLPASTMVLKTASDFLVGHWLLLAILVVFLGSSASLLFRLEKFRRLWQNFLLRLPLFRPLLQRAIVAQFAQQMALLLKTGTPFVEALRTVTRLTGNLVLKSELENMAQAVESGADIAPTMTGSRIFPPVVAHLVAVGQNSGELPIMLAELRKRYSAELELAITRFTTTLEPLLIVVLTSVIGFVVFACLTPILEVTRGIAA